MSSWGEQFSSGDQGPDKYTFWKAGMKTCPKCQGKDIKNKCCGAGCRHNGDAYGTETFECESCHWNTSFQFDEAGDGPYFYETRFWIESEERERNPVIAHRHMDAELTAKYDRVRKMATEAQTRLNMKEDGIFEADIDAFFETRK